MEDKYKSLRKQLNYLGYTQQFSMDSIPLIESLTADLIQTTRSLQYYMKVSKESLQERDSWKGAAEPYQFDNAKLIKENNKLHLDLLHCKEELMAKLNEHKSHYRELQDEYEKLQEQNSKLNARIRDYQLKNVCADTISSSKKMSYNMRCKNCGVDSSDSNVQIKNVRACTNCLKFKSQVEELSQELINSSKEQLNVKDNFRLLKLQLNQRNDEIKRLNKLLERPISMFTKECLCDDKNEELMQAKSQLLEYEALYENINKQLKDAFSKQHEAMSRAIQLAEENKILEKHLQTTDEMALKVEEECNSRLKENHEILNSLQKKNSNLSKQLQEQNAELKEISKSHEECAGTIEMKINTITSLTRTLDELTEVKNRLLEENKELLRIKNNLQNKLELKSESDAYLRKINEPDKESSSAKYGTGIPKEDLLQLLEKERKYYESHINEIKNKLNEQTKLNNLYKDSSFDRDTYEKLKNERDFYFKEYNLLNQKFQSERDIMGLQSKINNLEQHNLELENKIKGMDEEKKYLKLELDNSKRMQPSYETGRYSQQVLEHLEKDLYIANREIKKLEEERDLLIKKLQNATENESAYKRLHETKTARDIEYDNSTFLKLQRECNELRDNLKASELELLHTKSLYNQLKSLQTESDRSVTNNQSKIMEMRRELESLKIDLETSEKQKRDMEYELKLLRADKINLKENVNKIDKERDNLVIDVDNKTEKISTLEQQIRCKNTSIELLENKVTEFNRKLELLTKENTTLEHKVRDSQTCNDALSLELDTITKQRDNAIIENRRLQSDLAAVTSDLRSLKREYENSRKEVDGMKQQLQHYVDEVRRIEDILSRKEAERTEMLDHFASLSHEATILESSKHSLENEAASKNIQLQSANGKLSELEKKLKSRETLVEMQEEKIASLLYKISTLETDLVNQKSILKSTTEKLNEAQEMYTLIENQKKSILIGVGESDSERKSIEYELNILKKEQKQFEEILAKDKASIECLETLLADSRREVADLKLSLRDSLEENKILKKKVECFQKHMNIVENEGLSSRLRSEEAVKHLQELEQQMTDRRYQRARSSHSDLHPYSFGTL